MNGSRAKRDACWRSALLLEDAMASSDWLTELTEEDYTTPDLDKIRAGVRSLIDELKKRGRLKEGEN